MKNQSSLEKIAKVSAAIACTAFVAIAGAAVTTRATAPSATPSRATTIAAEPVVRLDPVTITMSRARFDALRAELDPDTAVARNEDRRTMTHG